MRPGSRKDNIEAACTTSRKDRSDVTWVRTFIIDRQAVLAIFTHIGGRACLVGAVDAVFGDMVPDPDQVRPRLRREDKTAGAGSFAVCPATGAYLPDLFKHGVSIQQLAAVGLLDAPPDLGPKLFQGSRARLLAFLEQAQSFANHFAGGLIPAGGHAGLDELLKFRGERDVQAGADRHTLINATPVPLVSICVTGCHVGRAAVGYRRFGRLTIGRSLPSWAGVHPCDGSPDPPASEATPRKPRSGQAVVIG